MPEWMQVFIVSMVPIAELRGAIPIGLLNSMHWWEVYIIAVIGNILPVPFILKLLPPVEKFLRKWKKWDAFFSWLFEHTRKRTEERIKKWESIGLILFVATPLPITGAWTGSLAAYLFNLDFKRSIICITIGVIAGVIVTIAVSAGIRIFFSM
ncbi:MAG: ligand-binding protein SH3 [Thermoplasmata archaeon]|nr:MAG: ligand-binding protein SH3 [Thermoplasmata archaeon]